jgi:plasmid stability protein
MRSSQTFMPTPLPRLVVGIPEDTRQQLRALAAAHHRNISGEVIAALESWIAMHSQADRAATAAGSLVKSWIAREADEASSTEEG